MCSNNICPACDNELPYHESVDNTELKPRPDDYTICVSCASYLKFNELLQLVLMDVDDIVEMSNECLLQLTSMRNKINKINELDC